MALFIIIGLYLPLTKGNPMIGFHLMMDGVFRRPLGRETLERLLSELPGVIGMNILYGPVVVKGEPENPGWTGFVIIDKSHISVHTFDESASVSVDVFSCKEFDGEAAKAYVKGLITFENLNVRLLERSEQ